MVDYEALIFVSAENARNEQGRLFPQPSGYVFYTIVGIILSSLPTLNTSQPSSRTIWASLTPSFSSFTIQHRLLDSIDLFSQDLVRRFEPDNEMDEILDPGRSSFTVSRVAFQARRFGWGVCNLARCYQWIESFALWNLCGDETPGRDSSEKSIPSPSTLSSDDARINAYCRFPASAPPNVFNWRRF